MSPSPNRDSERGAALILAIISLLIITGLATAMLTSARTESLISLNQERAAQARMAAEAGLNHGAQVTVNWVRNWQTNGFASATAAMNDLLNGPDNATGTTGSNADNGSLEGFGLARPPITTWNTWTSTGSVTLSTATNTSYFVRVYDEDDSARGLTLSSADYTRLGEDGTATIDANKRLLVQATGFAAGNTRFTLEATIGPLILPAIITNGNLLISGNPVVGGANGSVHANGNLTISGNPVISQDCTAGGTYSTSGSPSCASSGGNKPLITIPPVNAADHKPLVDFILQNDGRMTNQAETIVICDASSDNDACKNLGYGWKYEGSGNWNIDADVASNGAYYVEGDAKISGNPGSPPPPTSNLLAISIIAEGNIEINGNPDLRPDLPELLFVTNKDLKISGNFGQPTNIEGQLLVREQLSISGNPVLAGQIIVENAAAISSLVVSNEISGNPTIVYNGLVGSNTFEVTAWREVR